MKVGWVRSMGGGISFTHPRTFMPYGTRGSGKSNVLEHIGERYLNNGSGVLDLFGSRDGEGLAWCRSPWVDEKKILLLHGDNTSVASSFDSKNISKYSLSDLTKYDLIISSTPLYSSIDQEYRDINRVLDLCYKRRVWTRLIYIVIREAANLLYSRMKVSPDQAQAKAKMTYFIREARHSGFALGIDTLKITSVDIDVRITVDYMFFKSLGIQGLPRDLRWLYSFIKPFALQSMHPREFVILTASGSLGIGTCPEVKWHKKEGEDILKLCGIEVEHGEEMVDTYTKFKVGDLEHARFIKTRLAGDTYEEIASGEWSHETIRKHILSHNREIRVAGVCTRCERAKSLNKTRPVEQGRIKGKRGSLG